MHQHNGFVIETIVYFDNSYKHIAAYVYVTDKLNFLVMVETSQWDSIIRQACVRQRLLFRDGAPILVVEDDTVPSSEQL